MYLNKTEYFDKVKGCWLGKSIGGTLGAPMEWHRKWNDVTFYLQDLKGNPVPNDDLDLQIIALFALEQQGADLDANRLAEYFLQFCAPYWAEYGAAKSNLLSGILPPLSGNVNNAFKDSCGSFIRSELWACIAPGFPRVAVEYALNDAVIDHGDGEGVYAEVFCAAMQSAAFVESNLNTLIDIGLSYLPEDCACARAIGFARELYEKKLPLRRARDEMLRKFYSGFHFLVGEQEEKDGLGKGDVGKEVPSNIGIIILALLYGEGDFEKSICYAVNCGEDTDCTAGTIAALFGIIAGASGLPAKWTEPIGENIVTMCISLGDFPLPKTVGDMTERVYRMMRQVNYRKGLQIEMGEGATQGANAQDLMAGDTERLYRRMHTITHPFAMFDVSVGYPQGFRAETELFPIEIEVLNKSNLTTNVTVEWLPCAYAEVLPNSRRSYLNHYYRFLDDTGFRGHAKQKFLIRVSPEAPALLRLVCVIRADGRANTYSIPVYLEVGEQKHE